MPITFYIPTGPMNLADLFPSVNFNNVQEYYLTLEDQGDEGTILTSPTFQRSCCCSDDVIRLFYVNYLGHIDSINLKKLLEETETKSNEWKKSLSYPLGKFDGGWQRNGVESNETVTLENTCFSETDQEYLKELMATPNAWIQWEGTQTQSDDYIPVKIEDGKFVTRKTDERYNYALQIKFKFSNENQTVRN